jgi:hypothetical protein
VGSDAHRKLIQQLLFLYSQYISENALNCWKILIIYSWLLRQSATKSQLEKGSTTIEIIIKEKNFDEEESRVKPQVGKKWCGSLER